MKFIPIGVDKQKLNDVNCFLFIDSYKHIIIICMASFFMNCIGLYRLTTTERNLFGQCYLPIWNGAAIVEDFLKLAIYFYQTCRENNFKCNVLFYECLSSKYECNPCFCFQTRVCVFFADLKKKDNENISRSTC